MIPPEALAAYLQEGVGTSASGWSAPKDIRVLTDPPDRGPTGEATEILGSTTSGQVSYLSEAGYLTLVRLDFPDSTWDSPFARWCGNGNGKEFFCGVMTTGPLFYLLRKVGSEIGCTIYQREKPGPVGVLEEVGSWTAVET